MRRIFLYYPLIYLIILFVLDKLIFTLPFFEKSFIQGGNVVYYRQREILFEKLKNTKLDKKLILAMGDSRAYPYTELGFNDKQKKEYTLYNFSLPQAIPATSLFYLEKFYENKIIPKVVFLTVSPEAFNDDFKAMHKPFMRLAASNEFILKYYNQFSKDEMIEFMLDQFIVLRKIELDYKLLLSRFRSGKLNEYLPENNPRIKLLNLGKGEELSYTAFFNDEKKLASDSRRIKQIYFSNYKVHETQFFFLEKFLQLAQEHDTQVILIFPKVYKDYREIYVQEKIDEKVEKRIQALGEKYSAKYLSLDKESNCELFYDASHQSVSCFVDQIQLVMDRIR